MPKLFGEFLVESNLATGAQVLEALITQLRATPSTAEVIFDHALLPPTEQLRILGHQQTHSADFRTSAATLGLWNRTLAAQVAKLVSGRRRPLGEVLVELGFLTLDSLTLALDAYIETFQLPNLRPTEAPRPTIRHSQTSIDPALIKTFVETFEVEIGPALSSAAQLLGGASLAQDALVSTLRLALSRIVALRAASVLVSAMRTEELAKQLIATLEAVLNCVNAGYGSRIEIGILRDMFKLSIHVFNGICQLLRDFRSEEGLDADANLSDLSRRLAKAQERLLAQCLSAQRVA